MQVNCIIFDLEHATYYIFIFIPQCKIFTFNRLIKLHMIALRSDDVFNHYIIKTSFKINNLNSI